MEPEGLLPLTEPLLEKAVEVYTRAFWSDPLTMYFFTSEEQRRRLLPLFAEYRLRYGMRYAHVFTTSEDVEGIAVWTHSDSDKGSLLRSFRTGGLRLIRACGLSLTKKMLRVQEFTEENRARYAELPYMHLSSFAVDPEHQGKGVASRLVRPVLAHLDANSIYGYLETQSERNVSIYRHYGFEVLAEVTLLDTDIPHWDMIRRPRQPSGGDAPS